MKNLDNVKSEEKRKSNFRFSIFNVSLIALVCMFAFYSCDPIREAATQKFPVSSASFELNEINVDQGTAKSDELNTFNSVQPITLRDVLGFSDEILEYQSKIKDITVGYVIITITSPDNEEGIVKDFSLLADGISGGFNITQYTLGEELRVSTADILNFSADLLHDVFLHDVTIRVAGKTNLPAGEKLIVNVTMGDSVIEVALLD